jgi:hypothetical protein
MAGEFRAARTCATQECSQVFDPRTQTGERVTDIVLPAGEGFVRAHRAPPAWQRPAAAVKPAATES